jgi:hypothetical protein
VMPVPAELPIVGIGSARVCDTTDPPDLSPLSPEERAEYRQWVVENCSEPEECLTCLTGAGPSVTTAAFKYVLSAGRVLDNEGGVAVGGVFELTSGSSTSARTVVRVLPGGKVRGDGMVSGVLTVGGGQYESNDSVAIVSPTGLASKVSVGVLTVGTLSLNAGGRYIAEIHGDQPGVGYDQLLVTDRVVLNSPRLTLLNAFTPRPGTNFMIVKNNGSQPVAGTFVDSAGNPLLEGAILPESFGAGLVPRISYRGGDGNDVVIRVTTAPKVVGITSSSPAGVLKVGDTITIQVALSKPVTVTGSPRLKLNVGDMRFAEYAGGSSSSLLSFTYTVQAGDVTSRLDVFNATPFRLNGGEVLDAAGNRADFRFVAPGQPGTLSASKVISVDGLVPVVLGIGSRTTSSGTYRVGARLTIEVLLSEPVTISGKPRLALKLDSSRARYATYSKGSGSNTIQFVYQVAAGDRAVRLDYLGATALQLAGGTISDRARNAALLTLADNGLPGSLAALRNIVVKQ